MHQRSLLLQLHRAGDAFVAGGQALRFGQFLHGVAFGQHQRNDDAVAVWIRELHGQLALLTGEGVLLDEGDDRGTDIEEVAARIDRLAEVQLHACFGRIEPIDRQLRDRDAGPLLVFLYERVVVFAAAVTAAQVIGRLIGFGVRFGAFQLPFFRQTGRDL